MASSALGHPRVDVFQGIARWKHRHWRAFRGISPKAAILKRAEKPLSTPLPRLCDQEAPEGLTDATVNEPSEAVDAAERKSESCRNIAPHVSPLLLPVCGTKSPIDSPRLSAELIAIGIHLAANHLRIASVARRRTRRADANVSVRTSLKHGDRFTDEDIGTRQWAAGTLDRNPPTRPIDGSPRRIDPEHGESFRTRSRTRPPQFTPAFQCRTTAELRMLRRRYGLRRDRRRSPGEHAERDECPHPARTGDEQASLEEAHH